MVQQQLLAGSSVLAGPECARVSDCTGCEQVSRSSALGAGPARIAWIQEILRQETRLVEAALLSRKKPLTTPGVAVNITFPSKLRAIPLPTYQTFRDLLFTILSAMWLRVRSTAQPPTQVRHQLFQAAVALICGFQICKP